MTKNILGVMSGSSLDGLDMALCLFEESGERIAWKIIEAKTIPFDAYWRNRLQSASTLTGHELMQLDADFGKFIGLCVFDWMKEKDLEADCIASHGHTVFHEPGLSFTTQIGNGAHIAALTNTDTLVDFRQADVANGGQGAPFAPVIDRDLFSGYDGYLNLGGIANISLDFHEAGWKGWDICPCNQVLNILSNRSGKGFDENGEMAASGKSIDDVQRKLTEFFPPPPNTIFSLSNAFVQTTWIAYLQSRPESTKDLLATTTKAIARTIVQHLQQDPNPKRILVTGGGAHNVHLINLLNQEGNALNIVFEKPEVMVIDFKECLLMAYLGYLTLNDRSYRLSSITGARADSIGGAHYKALK